MCYNLQANEELRQKLSSPHPQNLRSPTNHLPDVAVHQRVESTLEQQGHQWAESSQEEPGHQWAESSQEEPGRQEVGSISCDREPVESSLDQLTQQVVACSPPSGGKSSHDQLVQQWVEPSDDNNHIKYYPPVKSPV